VKEVTVMERFYGLVNGEGRIAAVFKLGLPDNGITESVWNAETHAWEDCSPTLVGWLVFGNPHLESLVSEQVAAAFPGSTKSYSVKYSDDQERDEHGRWTSGGGAAAAAGNLKEPDGGFTYDPRSGSFATTGYAVSTNPERGVVIPNVASLSTAQVAKAINAFSRANADIFAQPGTHVGAWHDPDTGEGDLDVSRVVSTPAEAESLASAHNQIAYFDLAKGESVTVSREATGSR